MVKAGIVIDDWKLPIFKRHLDEAGIEYQQNPGLTDDSLLLVAQVEAQQMEALAAVVLAANKEAARGRLQ